MFFAIENLQNLVALKTTKGPTISTLTRINIVILTVVGILNCSEAVMEILSVFLFNIPP